MHKAKKDIYSILHSSLESIQCLRLGMGNFPFILSSKLYNRYMYICKHLLLFEYRYLIFSVNHYQ